MATPGDDEEWTPQDYETYKLATGATPPPPGDISPREAGKGIGVVTGIVTVPIGMLLFAGIGGLIGKGKGAAFGAFLGGGIGLAVAMKAGFSAKKLVKEHTPK